MTQTYADQEGKFLPDGSWVAAEGSPFRSLSAAEVGDLLAMANDTSPVFGGAHNASWGEQHPLARDVWAARGLKPAGEK